MSRIGIVNTVHIVAYWALIAHIALQIIAEKFSEAAAVSLVAPIAFLTGIGFRYMFSNMERVHTKLFTPFTVLFCMILLPYFGVLACKYPDRLK